MFPLQQYIFRIFHCLEHNHRVFYQILSCSWLVSVEQEGPVFPNFLRKIRHIPTLQNSQASHPSSFSVWWHLPYIIEIRMFTPNNSSMPLLTLWLIQNNYSEYDVTEPDISTGDKLFQREGSNLHTLRLNHQGSFWPCGSIVLWVLGCK